MTPVKAIRVGVGLYTGKRDAQNVSTAFDDCGNNIRFKIY